MTPEQEEQVRRALAAAGRDDQPMPPEVAARLDDVLAGLVSEQAAGQAAEPGAETGAEPGAEPPRHDEVAAARRRRRVRVLLAAAVVCLVALGGTALVRRGPVSGEASSSGGQAAAPPQTRQPTPDTGSSAGSGSGSAAAGAAVALPRLHTGTLATDVERLLAGGPSAFTVRPQPPGAAPSTGHAPSQTKECARPPARAGDRLVAVRLDGRPATLRLGPAVNGTRVAQVYSCDGASTPVASTRVGGG